LGLLVLILAAAKLCGAVAQRIGQPAVLGELVAGVVLANLALIDRANEVLHLLAELGVIILLFAIGLETDLRKILRVGGTATTVAVVGVTDAPNADDQNDLGVSDLRALDHYREQLVTGLKRR
jgi:Kef-type K+ transport system membrane component KefB